MRYAVVLNGRVADIVLSVANLSDQWVESETAQIGDEYLDGVFTTPAPPDPAIAAAAQVRSERNAKLTASDWTQVADAPVDQAAWAVYRQALRDVTAQQGFPWTVDWPTIP